MKTTMPYQSPLMTFICVTFGSFTAILTEPNAEFTKAFFLGAIGGCGAYIAKSLLDKIVNYFRNL